MKSRNVLADFSLQLANFSHNNASSEQLSMKKLKERKKR